MTLQRSQYMHPTLLLYVCGARTMHVCPRLQQFYFLSLHWRAIVSWISGGGVKCYLWRSTYCCNLQLPANRFPTHRHTPQCRKIFSFIVRMMEFRRSCVWARVAWTVRQYLYGFCVASNCSSCHRNQFIPFYCRCVFVCVLSYLRSSDICPAFSFVCRKINGLAFGTTAPLLSQAHTG